VSSTIGTPIASAARASAARRAAPIERPLGFWKLGSA